MAVIAVLVGIAVASLFRPVSSLPPLELSSHLSAREASVVTESPISSFEIPEVEVYDEDTLNSILEAHYSRKSRLAKREYVNFDREPTNQSPQATIPDQPRAILLI